MKSLKTLLATVAAGMIAATGVMASAPDASASTGQDERFVPYTASNGASSNYHYYPSGVPGSGLVVYLDGDGQWGHNNPSSSYALGGSQGIVSQARARGLDVMSVHTPNRDKTWWTDCNRNAAYLQDLLTKVKSEKNINNSDVWITGFSGGAQFTTQCYLPKHANSITDGGTIVFGGGGKPYTTVTPFTPETKANLSLNWITGADDTAANSPERYDALWYAKDGAKWYRNAGFSTWEHYPAGVDHNDIGGQFGAYIGSVIDRDRASTPTPPPPTDPTPPTEPEPTPDPDPSEPAPITTWKTTVKVARDYADITVIVPSGAKNNTTVWIDGPNGTYWYEYIKGRGTKTVRMGDPGDMLSPNTTYTYKVTNHGKTYATGKFTTLP